MTKKDLVGVKRCSGRCALGSAILMITTLFLGLQLKLSVDSRSASTLLDYESGVRNASQYLRSILSAVTEVEAREEDPIMPPKALTRSKAQRCNSTKDAPFLSQSGEDKYLLQNFFSNVCGGSYIEMGALDGKKFSNSYYFNKALGWKGLLVEASPQNYKQLKVNRRDELVPPIHAAVCDVEKDVHWISQGAVGGIVEFAPKSFQKQWWKKDVIDNATVIKCMPLNQIIHNTAIGSEGGAFFDFFSLDVEGAEYDVLKTIDFDDIVFGVIFYESDAHNPLKNMIVRTFLESKGYTFLVYYERSNWHINSRFAEIYADLVHDAK